MDLTWLIGEVQCGRLSSRHDHKGHAYRSFDEQHGEMAIGRLMSIRSGRIREKSWGKVVLFGIERKTRAIMRRSECPDGLHDHKKNTERIARLLCIPGDREHG